MAEFLKLTPYESVEIVSTSPECLEVKAAYTAAGTPPRHWHPEQDEEFELLTGTLVVELAGSERRLTAGETIEIPRRTVHRMWAVGEEQATALWRTSPPGRTEQWFRAIDALHREGRVGRDGMPGPLAFGVMLSEYRDVFRLAGPDPLLRPALAALGALGRARGYSASAPITPTTQVGP